MEKAYFGLFGILSLSFSLFCLWFLFQAEWSRALGSFLAFFFCGIIIHSTQIMIKRKEKEENDKKRNRKTTTNGVRGNAGEWNILLKSTLQDRNDK